MSDSARIDFDSTLAAKAVSQDDSGDLIIEGYASTWDTDRQGEAFDFGSFGEAIKSFLSGAAPLLYQHRDGEQMGVVEHLEEREKGLWMRARAPEPPAGTEAHHRWNLLKRGMLRGASVRGKILKLGNRIRMKDMYEISMTPAPVNAGGLVAVAAKALGEDEQQPAPDAPVEDVRKWLESMFEKANEAFDGVEERLKHLETAIPAVAKDESSEGDES